MIKATVGNSEFLIEKNTLNGHEWGWDIQPIGAGGFHIIKSNRSYNATVLNINHEEKTLLLRINANEYEVSIKDKYDLLLQQMGMNASSGTKINTFKAPMPGLIRSILVEAGCEVSKGDTLLILEAMKMENGLKSPRDGRVKRVSVSEGQAVEKGQLLVEFE